MATRGTIADWIGKRVSWMEARADETSARCAGMVASTKGKHLTVATDDGFLVYVLPELVMEEESDA